MVLKARDYGFIGLKLKGLIFHESGIVESMELTGLKDEVGNRNAAGRAMKTEKIAEGAT